MKVRTPTLKGEALTPPEFTAPKETNSVTYKVKVITPIYGGGVKAGEPDMDMPIRASAIRGQLRYWWRFLKMNDPDNPLEGEALFQAEREIWGGMGDKDDAFASKVFVKISNLSSFSKKSVKPCGHYEERQNRNTGKISFPFVFEHGIPPYSLFSAQGKPPKNRGESPQELPHNIILPSSEFTIEITANLKVDNQKEWSLIKEAVRWWSCFGGIGARTRRGLGSVVISEITTLTETDVKAYGCQLVKLKANTAIEAWETAIKKLQQFRQGVGIGRKQGNGNRPGRSYWPEPDSIRQITGKDGHPIEHDARISFPRAAFGLPIIFEIRGRGEPPKTELSPKSSERMSSPLILKAMVSGGNKYHAIALLLPTKKTVDVLEVSLDYVSLKKEITNRDEQRLLQRKLPKDFSVNERDSWWDSSKAKDVKPINDYKGDNNATNALDAFMNFFAQGGK